jgi:hypothetical protein
VRGQEIRRDAGCRAGRTGEAATQVARGLIVKAPELSDGAAVLFYGIIAHVLCVNH